MVYIRVSQNSGDPLLALPLPFPGAAVTPRETTSGCRTGKLTMQNNRKNFLLAQLCIGFLKDFEEKPLEDGLFRAFNDSQEKTQVLAISKDITTVTMIFEFLNVT